LFFLHPIIIYSGLAYKEGLAETRDVLVVVIRDAHLRQEDLLGRRVLPHVQVHSDCKGGMRISKRLTFFVDDGVTSH
jgi:hypothetical protein